MSDFTYQTNNAPVETYEWDNTWLDHADDGETPRVLYIGDSISCNCRRVATELAEGNLLFDGFGTSKALDNPFFKESICLFAAQQGRRCALLFNNGLHGWHLEDETDYRHLYEQTVKFLLSEFAGTPLYIVLTTHVSDQARNARVEARNRVAAEIAKAHGLPVIDLYAVSLTAKEYLRDGVHYHPEGNRLLARFIVDALQTAKKSASPQ